MDAETPTLEEASAPPSHSRRRVWKLTLWAGGLALVAATLYLIAMAFLWRAQVGELTVIRNDLAGQLSDQEAALEDASASLEASRSELETTLDSLSELANEKAQAQDYQLLIEDVAIALADCASESGELLGYVYERHLYVPWSLWDYEDAVREYCGELSGAFSELSAEAEEALS